MEVTEDSRPDYSGLCLGVALPNKVVRGRPQCDCRNRTNKRVSQLQHRSKFQRWPKSQPEQSLSVLQVLCGIRAVEDDPGHRGDRATIGTAIAFWGESGPVVTSAASSANNNIGGSPPADKACCGAIAYKTNPANQIVDSIRRVCIPPKTHSAPMQDFDPAFAPPWSASADA